VSKKVCFFTHFTRFFTQWPRVKDHTRVRKDTPYQKPDDKAGGRLLIPAEHYGGKTDAQLENQGDGVKFVE
jgi:hypothetical protein